MANLVYRLGQSGRQKRSNPSDLGYYATGSRDGGNQDLAPPMPYSRRFKAIHTVRVEKDGKIIPRKVAYSPDEESIFMDDWVDKNSKVVKIKFKKGMLMVDEDNEPQLIELLSLLDGNESKPNRDTKTPVLFHQINKSKKAEEVLLNEERVAKELAVYWDLPYTRKQAIANWVGIRTANQDPNMWQHSLFLWAKHNVKKFKEVYHNPDLEYMDFISRAENIGLLKFNTNTWKYGEVKMLVVSRNDMRYEKLVERLLNEPSLYKSIADDVLRAEGKSNLIVAGKEKFDFDAMTAEDLLDKAKKHDLVKYKGGTGFYIVDTGKAVGKSTKEDAIKSIETDPYLRQQIEEQFKKLI
jgi:hypothetical protein